MKNLPFGSMIIESVSLFISSDFLHSSYLYFKPEFVVSSRIIKFTAFKYMFITSFSKKLGKAATLFNTQKHDLMGEKFVLVFPL